MFTAFLDFTCAAVQKIIPKSLRNNFRICPDKPQSPAEFEPDLSSIQDIKSKMGRIVDAERVEEALKYCKNLFYDEEKRQELIVNKANILVGFSGTSIAATLAFIAFLVDSDLVKESSSEFNIVLFLLTALLFFSLVRSGLFALETVKIGTYHRPLPRKIFDLAHTDIINMKRQTASRYYYSYQQNHFTNSRLVDAFNWGLNYFRVAMTLALIIFLILIGRGGFALGFESIVVTSTSTVTLTTTSTYTPTGTSTVNVSSTPAASITLSPTNMATTIPAVTRAVTATFAPSLSPSNRPANP